MQLRFLLLMAGLLLGHVRAYASHPAATTPDARQSKETRVRQQAVTLAQECQTMVGFRLGHMMSLQVQQVTAPTPPATTWAVIGEDKGQDPAVNWSKWPTEARISAAEASLCRENPLHHPIGAVASCGRPIFFLPPCRQNSPPAFSASILTPFRVDSLLPCHRREADGISGIFR